ncbi:unnamed protein product [Mytilus coruscus]|uniref:Uncharacterized protein n=1 Tax=Mytilus coruscus TaxID=42192 RepID=A0A6J8B892_MYTCO|nr:unnamed protein product [Mytilus coruscus]
MDVNTEIFSEANLLTNLLLPSSQQNTNKGTNTEPGIDTPIRPGRPQKRGNPDSPGDLPGTARQVTRQIRRRNSVGDLSSITSKKIPGFRKTIADKMVEALTSPEVLDQIMPVVTEKLCESIELSLKQFRLWPNPLTNLVKELADLKYRHSIHAYWTNDGRIYVKKTEASMKQLILNHDDICNLLRSNDLDESTGTNTDAKEENNQGVKDHD